MPKNLREKLSLVLDDTSALDKSERLRMLENLFEQELQLTKADYTIDAYDIAHIKSLASNSYAKNDISKYTLGTDISSDPEYIRFYYILDSMISFFRGKGLINFQISLKKTGRNKLS